MLRHDIGRLPVVSRDEPGKLIGMLTRSGAMAAEWKRPQEEHMRESGWFTKAARKKQTETTV